MLTFPLFSNMIALTDELIPPHWAVVIRNLGKPTIAAPPHQVLQPCPATIDSMSQLDGHELGTHAAFLQLAETLMSDKVPNFLSSRFMVYLSSSVDEFYDVTCRAIATPSRQHPLSFTPRSSNYMYY